MGRLKQRRNGRPKSAKLRGVIDSETDPFLYGRVPRPFAWGVYFENTDYHLFWGKHCVRQVVAFLHTLPACTLYAHNGGKFDFFFLIPHADPQTIKIVNGRIMHMRIGKIMLVDSLPLMPFALEEYKKTAIDYKIFEEDKRDIPKNREKIEKYLHDDCRFLFELITGFKEVVGPKPTIGAAAFWTMKEHGIKIEKQSEAHDDTFRPFYFGGRVEAIQPGIHRGKFHIYDINSAYPFAMMASHPYGKTYFRGSKLPKKPGAHFLVIRAISRGALPLRGKHGELLFPCDNVVRVYHATGWEVAAGLETGTLDIIEVLECLTPQKHINFKLWVTHYFKLRNKAKDDGDKIKRLAYKYLLNSGYGKWAQNPREFKSYELARYGENVEGYTPVQDFGGITLWECPDPSDHGYYDVAVGASITGFVRAMLWRAINASHNVLYCDTDSIICQRSAVEKGDKLGQWKLEMSATKVSIAGKKLYAATNGEETKKASKGARLETREIEQIAGGKEITWENIAPSFSATKKPSFVKRRINRTGAKKTRNKRK